jgi:putative methyltransferase
MKKLNSKKRFSHTFTFHSGLFKLIKPYYAGWNSSLVMLKIEKKAKSNAELISSHDDQQEIIKIDRFFRVNTLKTTINDFIQEMESQKYPLRTSPDVKCIMHDEHIPELFRLYPSDTTVHNMNCVRDSTCIVQDKASCMPVHVMFQVLPMVISKEDFPIHIIDGCAAPGNKTTFLAAKLASMSGSEQDPNVIHAFDRDTKRVKVLSDP